MEPTSEQPKPIEEQPRQTPTEASKGFLREARLTLKRIGILLTPGGAGALAFIEANGGLENNKPKQPESAKPTPTQASDSFLKYYFTKELGPILNNATKFPAAFVTEIVSGVGIKALGGFNPVPDIAEGRWGTLAAKGVILGIMATPFVRLAKNALKTNE